MIIHLRYYAHLHDEAGIDEETIECEATTAADLYRLLMERHRFTLDPSYLLVAINNRLVSHEQPLRDGDRVVFIPPFAGG